MKVLHIVGMEGRAVAQRLQQYIAARNGLKAALEAFGKNYDFIADEDRWAQALQCHCHTRDAVSTVLDQRIQAMVDLAWRRTDLLRKIEAYENHRKWLYYAFTYTLSDLEQKSPRFIYDKGDLPLMHNNIIAAAHEFAQRAPDYSQAQALAQSFGKYEELIWNAVKSSFERVVATVEQVPVPYKDRNVDMQALGAAYPTEGVTNAPAYGVTSSIYSDALPDGFGELPRSVVGLIFKSGDYSSYQPTSMLAECLQQLVAAAEGAEVAAQEFKKEKGRLNEKNFRERLSYLTDVYAQSERANEISVLIGKQNQLRLDFEGSRLAAHQAVRSLADTRGFTAYHLNNAVKRIRDVLRDYCSAADFAASQPTAAKLEVTHLMLVCLAVDHRLRLFGTRLPGLFRRVEDDITNGEANHIFTTELEAVKARYTTRFTGPDAVNLARLDLEEARSA